MRKKALSAIGLFAVMSWTVAVPASAEEGRRLRADRRIRSVLYEEGKVLPLVIHSFRVAMIEFETGERVQSVVVGDTESWDIQENAAGDRVFVKAKAEGVSSNAIVVTDRRSYVLGLESRREGDRMADTVYRVRFTYPEDMRASVRRRAEQQEEQEREKLQTEERDRTLEDVSEDWNGEYQWSGDEALVPRYVFDDGYSTFFRFESAKDLPAIFVVQDVGGEKRESLANYRIDGEYVVVHRVAGQFSLRSGERLVCIFNEARVRKSRRERLRRGPIKREVSAGKRWSLAGMFGWLP